MVCAYSCLFCVLFCAVDLGLTGCGKTVLLQHLQDGGHQVLDLEGLAKHKGSLLGLWHQSAQPSQKMFDSLVRQQLASFRPDRPVWVESESSKIGTVQIPVTLFRKMQAADRVEVSLPLAQRVQHLMRDYPHWMEDASALKRLLQCLKKVRGKATVDVWLQLVDQGRWSEFVEQILVQHYDLTYNVSQRKNCKSGAVATVHLADLSEESKSQFASAVTNEALCNTAKRTETVC